MSELNISEVPSYIFGIASTDVNSLSKSRKMSSEKDKKMRSASGSKSRSASGSSSSVSSSSSGTESESGSASEGKPKVSKSLFESDKSDNSDKGNLTESEGEEDEDTEEDVPEVKTSRRQTTREIKKSMESMPDIYGVRRSVRSRKEPTRYTEHGSDSDSDQPRSRRKPRRNKSHDEYEGETEGSSDDDSSDTDSYQPKRNIVKRSVKGRGRGRPPAGRKKRMATYSDSDEDNFKRTSLRSTTKGISYKEDSDGKTDSDDIVEPTEMQVREQEEQALRETIERVLDHRTGRADAIGSKTTIYNVDENGDPNLTDLNSSDASSDTQNTEEAKIDGSVQVPQYLIKWKGWSYIHATWESDHSLEKKVNGIKKLENFRKRQAEIDAWKMCATPEEVEYFDCQNEMMAELYQCYLHVDRIIDHSNEKGVIHPDYYVKWQGLPYAECTWETGDLVTKRFQTKVDEYHARNKSHTIPNKLCKALKQHPKFHPITEQPDFIGEIEKYELRDYQLEGLNWLIQSWSKYNSVILADEMGLGKTIQVISFLSYLANTYQLYGPFIIVIPLSTVVAWQREFTLWAPEMNVVTYLGDTASRTKLREYEFHQPGNKRIKFNALITTYEILLKDKTQLGSFHWAMLVVDEAHRLKNDDSLLYRCLAEFTSNHRLLITGTPLQNSLKELWSLLHFIMPHKFDSWDEFEDRHSKAESQGFSGLHKELQPFLLRRVKKDVEKSLPAKVERILRVEMSSIQKEYSRLILAKNYKALSKGVKGSIVGFINIMMELKKCCNHAFITRPQDNPYTSGAEQLQALIRGSGKMLLLDKLLVRLKETGHRVLIFSQMVRMLDLIAEYLRHKQFQFQRLDGSIRGDIRKQALDHFNAEGSQDFCFLLSTRAGGLGVNLATADTVIIFDSDWNPQNDLQAQARAHRIGQKNQVSVYRLVCKNSVEETIVERAKRKMVLDHLVIQRMDTTGRTILNRDKSSNNTPFNKEELTSILKFGAEDLFKEGQNDEEEPQVDIDDILMRAETRETEQSSGGDDLLSNFKVVSFDNLEEEDDKKRALNMDEDSVDKDWDDIIPEDTRRKVDEDEKQKQMLELHLPPRSRKTIQQLEKEYDSDEGEKRGSRRRDDVEDESESSGEEEEEERPKKGRGRGRGGNKEAGAFTSMEVRKFIKSYKKFANPFQRLDAIAGDAELQEKSEAELRGLAELIKGRCDEAVRAYRAQQMEEQPQEGKKANRGPTFKIANVTINATTLAKTMEDLEPLSYLPADKDQRKQYTMNCQVKDAHWDCDWEIDDDTNLIRGVYEYGMGNWEQIKMDQEFRLHDKILPGTATKPQAKHLQTRMEYLLRILKKVSHPDVEEPHQPKRERKKRTQKPKPDDKNSTSNNNGDINNHTKAEGGNSIQDTARKKKSKKKEEKSAEFIDSMSSGEENNENVNHSKKKKPSKDAKHKNKSTKKKKSEALHITAKSQPVPVEEEITLSSDVFAQCKDKMRPVKKALKQLDNPEGELSEKETIRHIMQCLLTIGDHIAVCLGKLGEPDEIRQLRSNLWIFVSNFTDFEPSRLHKMYKHAVRKRDDKAQSQPKESTQANTEKPSHKPNEESNETKTSGEDKHHSRHEHSSSRKEEHRKEEHRKEEHRKEEHRKEEHRKDEHCKEEHRKEDHKEHSSSRKEEHRKEERHKEDHHKEHRRDRDREHSKEHSKRSSNSSSHHRDNSSSRSGSTPSSQHRSNKSSSPSDRWTHSSPLVRAEEQQNRFNNNSTSKGSFRKYRTYPGGESKSNEYNQSYQRYNHERPAPPREPHVYNRNDPRDYRYPPPEPSYPGPAFPPQGVEYWPQPHPDPMMGGYAPPPHAAIPYDDRYMQGPQGMGERKRKAEPHDTYHKDRKLHDGYGHPQQPQHYPPH